MAVEAELLASCAELIIGKSGERTVVLSRDSADKRPLACVNTNDDVVSSGRIIHQARIKSLHEIDVLSIWAKLHDFNKVDSKEASSPSSAVNFIANCGGKIGLTCSCLTSIALITKVTSNCIVRKCANIFH